jgi:hypothetical protein
MSSATSFGFAGRPRGDAAKRFHDDLFAAFVICAGLRRETLRHGDGRLGFHPAR